MSSKNEYRTESLDLASWLLAHDYVLVGLQSISSRRHDFVFQDPDGTAHALAIQFGNSLTTKTLDARKRLITIARAGKIQLPTGKD